VVGTLLQHTLIKKAQVSTHWGVDAGD